MARDRLDTVRVGARRVGHVARSVEDGISSIAGILTDVQKGVKAIVQAVQSLRDTNERVARMEIALDKLEKASENKKRKKKEVTVG